MSGQPLAILLGAGASVPYGIPMMRGFYEDFRSHVAAKHRDCQPLLERLESRRSTSDLETLLTDLDLITRTSEGLGLLGGDGDGLAEIFGLASDLRGYLDAFIIDRCENFDRSRSAQDLQALVGLSDLGPLWIFSTNYDRIVENACDEAGIPYDDGFLVGGTSAPLADWTGTFDAPVRVVKLHGSVNWYQESQSLSLHRLDRGYALPTREFHLFRGEQQLQPLMIIPTLEKEALGLPYIRLSVSLMDALRTSSVLIIIGSSLRDSHIRAYIQSRMDNLRVVIVGPHARAVGDVFSPPERTFAVDAGTSEFLTLGAARLRELATALAGSPDDTEVEAIVRTFVDALNGIVVNESDLHENPILEGLLSESRSDLPSSRATAARSLADHPHAAVVSRLEEMLELDPEPAVRVAAVWPLIELAGMDALAAVSHALQVDLATEVQLEAALALIGALPHADATEGLRMARSRTDLGRPVIQLLDESSPDVSAAPV